MNKEWRAVVVSNDPATQRVFTETLSRLQVEAEWASTVRECKQVFRRDTVDIVFCEERLEDGDYWAIYGAVTEGLIRKPKVVLISRTMTLQQCEQAERCGIFAVLEVPCRPSSIEWAVILAKRSVKAAPKAEPTVKLPKFDIFSGAVDHNATWVCATEGLANARERMDKIAAERPGRYFIFYAPDRNVVAQTDTTPRETNTKSRGESA